MTRTPTGVNLRLAALLAAAGRFEEARDRARSGRAAGLLRVGRPRSAQGHAAAGVRWVGRGSDPTLIPATARQLHATEAEAFSERLFHAWARRKRGLLVGRILTYLERWRQRFWLFGAGGLLAARGRGSLASRRVAPRKSASAT
jgi:hypothetical protein